MTAATLPDGPRVIREEDRPTRVEHRLARRENARRRLTAIALVAPLLVFIIFAFFAPLASMLYRSVYNPTVVELIPDTLDALHAWDGVGVPDDDVLTVFAIDLKRLANERTSGRLADELNRALPGISSVVKATARALRRAADSELVTNGAALLTEANERWATNEAWQAVRETGRSFRETYYLTAIDMEKLPDGTIQGRDVNIYVPLYLKTLRIALVISILTFLLGYPLAYYMANASPGTANILMVLVLLPFWTSLLVRTTAWIALLQTNGVVNSLLTSIGVIREPLEMMYTEFATVIAMTHILLPFMILPLYAVMKGIDPSYMRAAMSLGAKPVPAFFSVYFPMTLPGLSAGGLLVFIISVGYYITPALVGGANGQMISNVIAFHMQQTNNWELAAALGGLLLLVIMVLYWIYDRLVGADNIRLG